MIASIIFLFQILVSGTMFGNHLTVKLASQNIKLKQVYYSMLRIVSRLTLHKVRSNYRLPVSFVDSHERSLAIVERDNGMKHLIPNDAQMLIHEEQVPNDMEAWVQFDEPLLEQTMHKRREQIQSRTRAIVNRRHRIDQYKLYYPGYMK